MTTREILIAARALIDTPEKWTQFESARNINGVGCHPRSPDAVCFCTLGAIDRACQDDLNDYKALQTLQSIVGMVANFNDSHTHAEVLAAFDEAIARLDRGEV